MPPNPLARVRTICLALPEAHEVEAWGEATFRVRNKLFAMYASAESHHGGGRPGIWIKAAAGNQSLMLQFAPHRFFVPPYVGPSGWVGVWLDEAVEWGELEELLRDAYMLTAPKRVSARLGAPADADAAPRAKTTPATRRASPAAAKSAAPNPAGKTARQSAPKRAGKESRKSAPKRPKAKSTTRKRATGSAKRGAAKPLTRRAAAKSPRKQSGPRKRRD